MKKLIALSMIAAFTSLAEPASTATTPSTTGTAPSGTTSAPTSTGAVPDAKGPQVTSSESAKSTAPGKKHHKKKHHKKEGAESETKPAPKS